MKLNKITLLTILYLFSHLALSGEVERVVIRAPKESLKMQDNRFTGESITSDEIFDQEASSVDDILNSLTGVTTTGGPRNVLEVPQVRGMEGDKVLLMIDGTKQNFRTHHSGGPNIDPVLLKRVDVVKSSASTRHGSGAMGGVVSYTTKDASDFLEKGKTFGGRFSNAYHSGNDERTHGATFYGEQEKISELVHIQKRDSHDIKQGGGTKLPHSANDDLLLYSKLGYKIKETDELKFSYDRMKNRYAIPLADAATIISPSSAVDTSRDKMLRQTYLLKYDHNQEKNRIESSLYQTSLDNEKVRSTDGRFDERSLTTSGVTFSQKLKYETHDLLWGGDFLYEDQDGKRNGSTLSSYPGGSGYIGGSFAEVGVPFFDHTFKVTPGVRLDGYRQKSSQMVGGEKKGDKVSKSLKSEYSPSEPWLFHLSYSEGYNVPRLEQLFPFGYHFSLGTTNNFVPNPSLRPEKARHYEAGIKFQREVFRSDDLLTLTYQTYQKDVEDYIDGYLSFTEGTTKFINLDFVRFRGHEMSLHYDINFLALKLGYTTVRAKKKNGHYLSKAPADELNWGFVVYGNERKHKIGYEGKQVMDQHRLDPSDQEPVYKTNSYMIHNAFLSYSFKKTLEAVLRVNNIFDIRYRRHTSYNYEMGRDVRFLVNYMF